MKLKFKKTGNEWESGIYQGKGGISSLVVVRHTKDFWYAIRIFSIKNLILYFQLKRWAGVHNR